MNWYTIAEIDVTDPSWVREYVAEVTKIVERRGGRYRLYRRRRTDGARNQFFLVAGEDVTGAATIES
jgi:uncharacterized protein (DUF1330 family)